MYVISQWPLGAVVFIGFQLKSIYSSHSWYYRGRRHEICREGADYGNKELSFDEKAAGAPDSNSIYVAEQLEAIVDHVRGNESGVGDVEI